MRRKHAMPFGAELRCDGAVRFRLWAPAAQGVEVNIERANGTRALALQPGDGGWFEAVQPGLPPGALYAYRIDGGEPLPDPASRFNPHDAHGPSAVVDPRAFEWSDGAWRGRPWHEVVLYELHVGAFTPQGT